MAASPRVLDGKGSAVALGTEIGRGGEGAVYEILGRADSVAKVYLNPPNAAHQAKLAAMTGMAAPGLLKLAAWPTSTLHGPSGSVTGFVMPKVAGHNPVFKLYGPKLRLREFPQADWRFLIHAAANVARAFSAVHASGLVIGDVNHGNLVIGQDATVRLIDCDSFQVSKDRKTWFCEVGVGTHQPPEMQALASYAGVTRTPNHDNFGLAVIIFQLLCMGRHPFMGRYLIPGESPSIEEAITHSQYAYARNNKRTMMAAPPGSLPITALTPDLQDLFETAFAPGATSGGRPSGERWITALDKLGSSLRECPQNQAHRYLSSLTECPWCQIESASGTPLFPVIFITQPGAATGIAALWQEVTRIQEPLPFPALPNPNDRNVPPTSAAVAAAQTGRRLQIGSYAALAASSALSLVTAPPDLRLWPIMAVGALTAAIFKMRKPDTAGPEKRRFQEVKGDWNALQASWNTPAPYPHYADLRRELDANKAKHDGLPNVRAARLNQLSQQTRQKQLAEHLDRFPIASANITGVGKAKAATLSSHGIDTAGDVDQARILRVPGFGTVTTDRMMAWRRLHEQSFRFDPSRGIAPSDLAAVNRDIDMARMALERDIASGLGRLKAMALSAATHRKALECRSAELLPLYSQAAADARIVPGDVITHKRLLGLAGATAVLAILMFGIGRAPQAGIPVAKLVQLPAPAVVAPIPTALPTKPFKDVEAPRPAPTPPPPAIMPTPVAAPTPAFPDIGKVVLRQTANIRDAPNGQTIIREAPQGTVLKVYARRDGWVQVGDDAPWGWVYSRLLTDVP